MRRIEEDNNWMADVDFSTCEVTETELEYAEFHDGEPLNHMQLGQYFDAKWDELMEKLADTQANAETSSLSTSRDRGNGARYERDNFDFGNHADPFINTGNE